MALTLGLLGLFALLGLPLMRLCSPARDILLAPAYGLASSVWLAYCLSANFRLSGAQAMAWSCALLSVCAVVLLLAARRRWSGYWRDARPEWPPALLALALVGVLLTPALLCGLANFFGAVNFDFFYNSQDAVWLARHPVNAYAEQQSLLPLDWSANRQGRFAISLVAACGLDYLALDPLHFNTALLACLLLINALTFAVWVRTLFNLGGRARGAALVFFVFSGGFVQSYSYFLLGQLSAMPLFMLFGLWCARWLETRSASEKRAALIAMAMVFNALLVFYAILAGFALALLVLAGLLVRAAGAASPPAAARPPVLRALAGVLASCAGVFVLARCRALPETAATLMQWFSLSLHSAGIDRKALAVFSDYTTESFIPLLFGVLSYPSATSLLGLWSGNGRALNPGLLLLSLVILLTLCWAGRKCWRAPQLDVGAKATLAALGLLTLGAALVFFLRAAGYAIFKLSDWLAPLLLTPLWFAMLHARRRERGFMLAGALLLLANLCSAGFYLLPYISALGLRSSVNAPGINGLPGLGPLHARLQAYAGRPLLLNLSSGIANAWIAHELGPGPIGALSHNLQPLQDKDLPDAPCAARAPLRADAVLIDEGDDLIVMRPASLPPLGRERYRVLPLAQIERYAFFGQGAYPLERLSAEQARVAAMPPRFRWVERGVELYIYSRSPTRIDLALRAMPGYMDGAALRKLRLVSGHTVYRGSFSKEQPDMNFRQLALQAGLNCLLLESPDALRPRPRYGAWLRPEVQPDFRALNFALSQVIISDRGKKGDSYTR